MNVMPYSPITSVKLQRGIPLDNSYSDTLTWESLNDQYAYFDSKTRYTFNELTPVRMQNKIRLPIVADHALQCNYLVYQNSNFATKRFFCFITAVDWINSNMCEVTVELDVFQTWYFEMQIKPCYVEREHPDRDAYGENLVVENIDFGPYVDEPAQKTGAFNSYTAVIATAYDKGEAGGGYVGGLFTGLKYVAGLVDSPGEVEQLVDYLNSVVEANKVDAIASIFMMPTEFYTTGSAPKVVRADAKNVRNKIGTYTPKCKKLLTYPYNLLYVYTDDGHNAIYRYEYFQSATSCGFVMQCGMSCNPEVVLEPIAYNSQQFNIDESISLSGFPQCAFSIDTFKAYIAQNASSLVFQTAGSAVSLGGALLTGSPAMAGGAALGAASALQGLVMAMSKPNQTRGSQGTSTFTATREKDFYFVNKHITEEYAKIIDDYFWVYGYATNRVKRPNITGRKSWNYVKTADAKVTGAVPFDDLVTIKAAFNRGITFWHGDYVGEYGRNN